jgi:glycine cleavage system H protein
VVRLKDFLVGSIGRNSAETSGIILQDGGELRDHALAELPDEMWKDFQKNFLSRVD